MFVAQRSTVRRRLRLRLAGRACGDAGFSLLESVVALAIATGVILSLGMALGTGLRSNLLGRQNQTASDVATERLEAIRQMPFAAAQLRTSDLSGDSAISSGKFDPGTGTPETVYASATGTINPHVTTVVRNGLTLTIGTYVTVPGDTAVPTATDYYHRLTVLVKWTTSGLAHTRRASTFLVNTQRGLPLPRFSFVTVGATSRTQDVGATPYWGFKVTNLGARDAWNISASSGSWTYYVDTNGDGVRDATENTLLGDFDLNTVPDTGQLEPTTAISVVAVRTPLTAADATSCSTSACTVTFTVTSAAQPAAATASKSVSFSQRVTSSGSPSPSASPSASASASATPTATPLATAAPYPAPVAAVSGGTIRNYYLHNYVPNTSPVTTASATQTVMLADGNAPTNTAFYNYSTEQTGSTYGRVVLPGGSDTETNKTRVADWRYQAPNPMQFNGTATVTVYVLCVGSTGPVSLRASISDYNDATSLSSLNTVGGYGNATMTSCSTTTWTPLTIGVSLANFTLKNNDWLTFRVYSPSATAPTVRLLYDASPNYAAAAAMPQIKP